MSNNLYEGIKIFIVCVCVLALNTRVTLQLRSRLHLPASSQPAVGSWQSPYGLIVCESSQGVQPRLLLGLSPAARSGSSPRWAKNVLPTCWLGPGGGRAPCNSGERLCSHVPPSASSGCWSMYGRPGARWQSLTDFTQKFTLPHSSGLWLTNFQCTTADLIGKAK